MSNPPSVFLARLVGPTIMALAVTEPWNAHIFPASNAATVYLNGTILFVAGLAIILNHNVWCSAWPVLITVVGWSGLALGTFRMVFPEFVLRITDEKTAASPVITVLWVAGLLLSWKGYLGKE